MTDNIDYQLNATVDACHAITRTLQRLCAAAEAVSMSPTESFEPSTDTGILSRNTTGGGSTVYAPSHVQVNDNVGRYSSNL